MGDSCWSNLTPFFSLLPLASYLKIGTNYISYAGYVEKKKKARVGGLFPPYPQYTPLNNQSK